MSAASRRKGATAERDVVAWLRANGFPYAERRAGGTPGPDITGCPGIAWEIKNAARLELAAWVDQAEAQRAAGGADVGPVVIKRKGTTQVGAYYAVLPLEQLARLLVDAGYGAPSTANERTS